MKKSFLYLAAVTVLFSVTLTSCKEEEKTIEVQDIYLDLSSKNDICPEDAFTLVATIEPENATNQGVRWQSSNASVATVSGDGLTATVTGVSIGTANITVTTVDGDIKKTCRVTVVARKYPVESVTLTAPGDGIIDEIGGTLQLTTAIFPTNATNQSVEYSTSNDKVATVDKNTGEVTATGCGLATITVTTSDGKKTAEAEITVHVKVTGISELRETLKLEIPLDETAPKPTWTLTYRVLPETACDKTVRWACDIPSIASVDERGVVTGLSVGTAKIYAITNEGNFSMECVLTVVKETPIPPSGFDPTKAIVYNFSRGDGGTLFPEVFDPLTSGGNARYVSMDLDHVLITGRELLDAPLLLHLAELKLNWIEPISLSQVGNAFGGYARSGGQLAHGHIYINNMTLGHASPTAAYGHPLRFFHHDKTKPNDPAELIGSLGSSGEEDRTPLPPTAIVRVGDRVSYNIDENGNGYIFAPGNAVDEILRITVRNFTELTDLAIISIPQAGLFSTVHQVEGAQDEYIYTGEQAPVRLITADGTILYEMTTFSYFQDGCAARVINFNGARYLLAMNKARNRGTENTDNFVPGVKEITVYDITRGATTLEALEMFDNASEEAKAPVFTFSLDGPPFSMSGATRVATEAAVDIQYVKDGDNKLYIVGSGIYSGFAIIEFPKLAD